MIRVNYNIAKVPLSMKIHNSVLTMSLELFDFKYIPQVPLLHTSFPKHGAAPQLQSPASQTSPVVEFMLQGSGTQGSTTSNKI
jgi:hypothetical protein